MTSPTAPVRYQHREHDLPPVLEAAGGRSGRLFNPVALHANEGILGVLTESWSTRLCARTQNRGARDSMSIELSRSGSRACGETSQPRCSDSSSPTPPASHSPVACAGSLGRWLCGTTGASSTTPSTITRVKPVGCAASPSKVTDPTEPRWFRIEAPSDSSAHAYDSKFCSPAPAEDQTRARDRRPHETASHPA